MLLLFMVMTSFVNRDWLLPTAVSVLQTTAAAPDSLAATMCPTRPSLDPIIGASLSTLAFGAFLSEQLRSPMATCTVHDTRALFPKRRLASVPPLGKRPASQRLGR